MPTALIDGIATRYEVMGSGPPLLMYAPGGFNATIETWRTQGIYARLKLLDRLPESYTCIVFDRRESGGSGGRVERINWSHYVSQGKGLLEHLHIERAHLMGGCMGCSPVLAFAVAHPEAVISMVLYWPAGGPRYRLSSRQRFAEHLSFAHREGLHAVVALARESGKAFGADPRVGPWASVIRGDPQFAARYVAQDLAAYELMVAGMERGLFDRDTTPGAEPEDLMRLDIPALIVPGHDRSHATSAARYLEECLPRAEYWDTSVADQTEAATSARILQFLAATASSP